MTYECVSLYRVDSINYNTLLQLLAVWVALPALLAVWHQTHRSQRMQMIRAYHEFFSEMPEESKRTRIAGLFEELGSPPPTLKNRLTNDGVLAIRSIFERDFRESNNPPEAARLKADNIITQYLNDFEELALAIKHGVVCEDYAYACEGSRVIGVYFGYLEWITAVRSEDGMILKKADGGGDQADVISRCFSGLEDLAISWLIVRTEEDHKAVVERYRRLFNRR